VLSAETAETVDEEEEAKETHLGQKKTNDVANNEKRHIVLAQKLSKERKQNIEKFLITKALYVLSFPTQTTHSPKIFPTDCAWFFNLQDKPDEYTLRCNLNYAECTTVAKIFHITQDLAFTDNFFLKKIPELWSECKGGDEPGITYPGIIHDEKHLNAINELPYLLEDDILLKTFSKQELSEFRAILQPGSQIFVCKAKSKTKQDVTEYFIVLHNTLPCWISDQINHIMRSNILEHSYEKWVNSKELTSARRISKRMQEKIIKRASEYLQVDTCDENDFCHTFTNVLKESFVPYNPKKKVPRLQTDVYSLMTGKKVVP
jgi:hypothetical protein